MLTTEEMLARARSLEHKAAAAGDDDLAGKYREVARGWRHLAVQAVFMDALGASVVDGPEPDAQPTSNIVYL